MVQSITPQTARVRESKKNDFSLPMKEGESVVIFIAEPSCSTAAFLVERRGILRKNIIRDYKCAKSMQRYKRKLEKNKK